jgi:hypothetical protein
MEKSKKDKFLFEVILFFTQLESMLKNHNILMKDKIMEGDLISSSIAFNNALILSSMQKIIKDNPIVEEYSQTAEFKERLNNAISAHQEKDKNTVN